MISYKINYNVNTGFDITVNTVIDSFSENNFDNGDPFIKGWEMVPTEAYSYGYTAATGKPAFYGGGTRVIGVFDGNGNNIKNNADMELKGPFTYGMVAEGGSNNLVNSQDALISDKDENDTVDSWYNNDIPHQGERIKYTITYSDGTPSNTSGCCACDTARSKLR